MYKLWRNSIEAVAEGDIYTPPPTPLKQPLVPFRQQSRLVVRFRLPQKVHSTTTTRMSHRRRDVRCSHRETLLGTFPDEESASFLRG